MSYIGNVPTTAAFPFDQFSGNGSTTAFTLSYAPAGATSIIVSISGVVQNPNTYSVSGTTLTFTLAPPTGTNNIAVLYLGLPVVASMTGTMEFIAGSAANPPIYPIGDTNTGIFFPAADTIAFTEGGTEVLRINSSAQIEFAAGSASTPSITFTGDTNTGIYSPSVDTIAFTEGGTEALRINSSAQVEFTVGTVSTPSLTFTGDTNTGIYSPSADTIAFTEGGTEVLRINSSAQVEFTDGTASLPSITNSGDTNTGIYFSAADTVDIATGGAQRGQFDASGNFLFNSGYGSVATAFGCRAWANINGSVSGVNSPRASGNVSSVNRTANGQFTISFSVAMPDANYSVVASANANGGALVSSMPNSTGYAANAPATGSFTMLTGSTAAGQNCLYVNIAVFR
jgi:hypothetical protein